MPISRSPAVSNLPTMTPAQLLDAARYKSATSKDRKISALKGGRKTRRHHKKSKKTRSRTRR
jgi:hypothetical protein